MPIIAAVGNRPPALAYGASRTPVVATSTLTSSASSFTAGGAGVTLTFTGRNAANTPVQGYTPTVEQGVT